MKKQYLFMFSILVLISNAVYASLLSVEAYTAKIGTAEHPTIEGGLINNTMPFIDKHPMTEPPKTIATSVIKKNKHEPFDDKWANTKTLRLLLEKASEKGKLGLVLKTSKELNMPATVALVPMVESQYQTSALSNKGAAGAWQLMPETARDYGLQQQERAQFGLSTVAALHFLNDLHLKLKNWELTFAAYNAGYGRVLKALKKKPHATSIESLDLPQETKQYVHRIKAINHALMETFHV